KKLSIEKDVADTLYSPRLDGIPCRVLDTEAARRADRKGFNPFVALMSSYTIAKHMRLPYLKVFLGLMGQGYKAMKQLAHMAMAFESLQKATEEGDTQTGILPVGQVTGLLHDEPAVVLVMERLIQEAKGRQKRLADVFE
ncbi:MAG: nitronate monooxygenase, partial [Syntrophaceae bacterium]